MAQVTKQRRIPRVGPSRIQATIQWTEQDVGGAQYKRAVSGYVINYHSRGLGASCAPPENVSQAILVLRREGSEEQVTKACRIVHPCKTTGTCGAELECAFTPEEEEKLDLAELRTGDAARCLAKSDIGEVQEEIMEIQSCRSMIFITTIGAMAAAAVAIGVAWLGAESSVSSSAAEWALLASFIGFVLLAIGIMATIEKARSINVRRGFLTAVTEWLLSGKRLDGYQGWAFLRNSLQTCRALRNLESSVCRNESRRCRGLGHEKAEPILRGKRPWPSLLHSFMSFCGWVFCGFYVFTCVSLTLSLLWVVPWPPSIAPQMAGLILLAFFGVGVARYTVLLLVQKYLSEKNREHKHVTCVAAVGSLLAMGMLMIGWVLAGTDGENARFWGAACVTSGLIFFVWVGFFIYKRFVIIVRRLGRTITNIVWHLAGSVLIWGACLGVGLGMWAGRSERIANTINEGILLAGLGLAWASIGMYMYDHFREVEKGKHSVETYHYAWQRIIDVCRPRPECPKAAEGALQTEDGG